MRYINKKSKKIQNEYKCKHVGCDTTLYKLNNMNDHIRKHTGDRPFICTVCNFAFSQIGNLNKHLIAKHNITPRLRDKNRPSKQIIKVYERKKKSS